MSSGAFVMLIICLVVGGFVLYAFGKQILAALAATLLGVGNIVLTVLASIPAAVVFMVGVGMWHGEHRNVPTIGFWPSLVIMLSLSLVASFSRD